MEGVETQFRLISGILEGKAFYLKNKNRPRTCPSGGFFVVWGRLRDWAQHL
jgi:hypothetical protein